MNNKEEIKTTFCRHQKEYFFQEIKYPPEGYIQAEWEQASQEYLKPILSVESLETYINKILDVECELIDIGISPIILNQVLILWRSKIASELRKIIRRHHFEEYKSKTPKRIFEQHRKTIKPQLIEYVKAFQIFQKLSDQSDYSIGEQVGMAGYLENNEKTYVHPLINDLGKKLKEAVSTQSSVSIEVRTADDLSENLKLIFPEYLKTFIEIIGKGSEKDKFFFEFRHESYGLSTILFYLQRAIEDFAEKNFGYEGRLIAQTLLERKKLESISNDFLKPTHRSRHRPEDIHLNNVILYLYENDVDEILIARLVNALENREHYKLQNDEMDSEWRVRKQQVVSLAVNRIRKAIRQRIKKLGGNSLRYHIDLLIKERKECRKCEWRYNENGILVRIPCKSHTRTKTTLDVRLASPAWKASLEKKGLEFYANALTFVPMETKSRNALKKKKDLVSDKKEL